jgi:phage terminase large subunit-like protein
VSRSSKASASRASSGGSKSSTAPTDYVAIAIGYAEDAVDDKRHYCHWVRCAGKRFLKDLKRAKAKRPPFLFSPAQANRACEFIEEMPHVEGTWDSETIELHPSQVFFVVNLFGFRKANGDRRFESALFSVARKNAKSTLAACIMNYCECMEREEGAQLLSAATTGSQARIVFNISKRMIDKLPDLREVFDVETFANSIVRYETGSVYKPINSKASTQDGLNPSHVVVDELHAHRTHDLLNVLKSAAGGRRNPLWLLTTTEGYESPGPWPEERSFAENVLNGVIEADHYLALLYTLDDKDDDYDERAWVKANPLADVNPNIISKMRQLAIEAKAKPGAAAEFRIKRLNRRSSSAIGWTNLSKWRRCAGPVNLDELVGHPCWGSYDLATTTDLVAWRILWKIRELFYTWGRFWVPADAVAARTERKSVNYAGWVEAGLIQQCDGATIDYAVVKRDVLSDIERFQPSMIAYDPWNAAQFTNELIDAGVDVARPEDPRGLMQFIQGPRSYTPAMKLCEETYLNERLRHGGDPVLQWNMANVVPAYDSNMNVKPDRKRSSDKIDGACSLFMCFGCAALEQPGDLSDWLGSMKAAS